MSSSGDRPRLRMGVLVSGSGTNLQAILDASTGERIDADVAVVISNRPRAKALDRARQAGVPTATVSHRKFDSRQDFEDELIRVLRQHEADWVVLAGFMRLLTGRFLGAFPRRVINIHPSLLPAFPGVDAQRQAVDSGVKISGCTVHFVDEGTDSGPIIAQVAVPVLDGDDADAVRARILRQEHRLYPGVLQLLAQGRVRWEGGRVFVSGGDLEGDASLLNPDLPRT